MEEPATLVSYGNHSHLSKLLLFPPKNQDDAALMVMRLALPMQTQQFSGVSSDNSDNSQSVLLRGFIYVE
jgi:hypothetical protein